MISLDLAAQGFSDRVRQCVFTFMFLVIELQLYSLIQLVVLLQIFWLSAAMQLKKYVLFFGGGEKFIYNKKRKKCHL